jgi:hypothetical protein
MAVYPGKYMAKMGLSACLRDQEFDLFCNMSYDILSED